MRFRAVRHRLLVAAVVLTAAVPFPLLRFNHLDVTYSVMGHGQP